MRAVTKSGTLTWDLGWEDSGMPGRGTWKCRDTGAWDSGTAGRGTLRCGDIGNRTQGHRDAGLKDVGRDKQIKEHLNFALNLQFTIFGGQEKGIV